MHRRQFLAAAAAAGLLPAPFAGAETPAGVLRVLSETGPNSFDSFSPGLNRQAIQISWNVYDRLIRFAYKDRSDGTASFDYFTLEGELAESWTVSEDGRAITFILRAGATFHDGRPVTAADVKWSLDRVVASPIGKSQFASGSMTDPAQFVVVDDRTIRIDLPQPDRFALPNLALTYPIIVNSELAKAHATAEDPFAMTWLQANPAGGGAFRVAEATLGERVVFERFEGWRSGARPGLDRVLWQVVPEPETRIAALARGEADVMQDVAPRDVARIAALPGVTVAGVPTQAFQFIGMNTQTPPFDNPKVRAAIAAALPFDDLFKAALHGRGQPLWGQAEPGDLRFPQPMGYVTNLDRARALMADVGPLTVPFAFDIGQAGVAEPVAILLQEALGKIGITVEIEKVPAGQLGSRLQDKAVPFFFEGSIAFLADPDYFFRIFYHGPTRWNFGSYDNAEFAGLVERTRFATDKAAYEADVARMIQLAKQDLPVILLWHPTLDVAMRDTVTGYSFAFHRMLDLRPLGKV
jgi:peptide/nickel transport system substrate-binding protein